MSDRLIRNLIVLLVPTVIWILSESKTKLAGKTIFITGASRGIGLAIALKAAKDGANLVIAAKTKDPHPKLPGTIFTAAEAVEKAGGKALPCVVDVRDEKQIIEAVENAVKKFGGLDILINNASAIQLSGTVETDMKRYDLMHSVNTRGTYLASKICIPYLKKSSNPHIMNISPPINLGAHWFKNHVAYTMAKYGMSMCVLGMAEEFKGEIAVNALWPRTAIQTAAIEMLASGDNSSDKFCRKSEIMSDAAYLVLCKDKSFTGNFIIDDEILTEAGLTEKQIDQYACIPGNKDLLADFFLDVVMTKGKKVGTRSFSTSAAARAADTGSGVEGIFNKIKSGLNADLVSSVGALYQFNLTSGGKEENWFIDLRSGEGNVGKGKPSDNPDATLSLNTENFSKMFSGQLKPTAAFMTGKLKISGNMQKAMQLDKLLSSVKSKL